MFRSLILSACVIGVILGLVVTAAQMFGVTPILLDAEQYEATEAVAPRTHSHDEVAAPHHHGEDSWAPTDGAERTFYTAISNISAGIGFAAVMLVVMMQLSERGKLTPTPSRGLLLGIIGYLAVFVAPSIGLPPEIPGTTAASLESRQLWWVFTVLMSLAGFGFLFLAQNQLKLVGILLLTVPYFLVPAQPDGPLFSHPDPAVVVTLSQLHQQFLWATGITNLIFWVLAGLLCAFAVKRIYEAQTGQHDEAAT